MKPVEFQYAKALLDITSEKNLQEKLYLLLINKIDELHSTIKHLNYFFENPSVATENKVKIFLEISDIEKEPILESFFSTLFENKRFRYLHKILKAYMQQYEKKYSTKRIKIIFASNVNKDIVENLKNLIEKKIQGFKLIFDYFVDPYLLGGYKIMFDDVIIDSSLKTKINSFIS